MIIMMIFSKHFENPSVCTRKGAEKLMHIIYWHERASHRSHFKSVEDYFEFTVFRKKERYAFDFALDAIKSLRSV